MVRVAQVLIKKIAEKLKNALMDLLPIIGVVSFFQYFVIQQPIPNIEQVLIGLVFVVVGLMLFVEGLEIGLFPIGESMAYALAKKGSVFWLLTFAFLLGFSTTIAEPALIAIAAKAADISAENGILEVSEAAQYSYSLGIRLVVAFAVGSSIVLGIFRIIKGWPIHLMIIGGYCLVMILTIFAPEEIIGLAYDVGGVTTSTITVPLVTALGVGLASVVKGRNPLTDGFGLIAFATVMPMIFVLVFGMITFK